MKPDLILWDWDNTLMDTRPAAARALIETAAQSGAPAPTQQDITDVIGSHLGQYWFDTYGDQAIEKIDLFLRLYQMHADMITPYETAKPLLRWVQAKGIRQIVTSNKNQEIIDAEADRFQLRPYFEKIVGVRHHENAKPSPAYARTALGLDWPAHMIVIGDGESDMQFARMIGAFGLFIRPDNRPVPFSYDAKVDDLRGVWQYLQKYFGV